MHQISGWPRSHIGKGKAISGLRRKASILSRCCQGVSSLAPSPRSHQVNPQGFSENCQPLELTDHKEIFFVLLLWYASVAEMQQRNRGILGPQGVEMQVKSTVSASTVQCVRAVPSVSLSASAFGTETEAAWRQAAVAAKDI